VIYIYSLFHYNAGASYVTSTKIFDQTKSQWNLAGTKNDSQYSSNEGSNLQALEVWYSYHLYSQLQCSLIWHASRKHYHYQCQLPTQTEIVHFKLKIIKNKFSWKHKFTSSKKPLTRSIVEARFAGSMRSILLSTTIILSQVISPMTRHSAVCVWMPFVMSTISNIKSIIWAPEMNRQTTHFTSHFAAQSATQIYSLPLSLCLRGLFL